MAINRLCPHRCVLVAISGPCYNGKEFKAGKRWTMPLYEYRCDDCQHLSTLLVYSWSKSDNHTCSHCGGSQLTKLVSRFAVRRSWGESLDWAPSGETLRDVDEDDPHSIDRFMGRIKGEMGGQVTSDFEEMRRELHSDHDHSHHGHSHHDHSH